jgi:hypothetical protein
MKERYTDTNHYLPDDLRDETLLATITGLHREMVLKDESARYRQQKVLNSVREYAYMRWANMNSWVPALKEFGLRSVEQGKRFHRDWLMFYELDVDRIQRFFDHQEFFISTPGLGSRPAAIVNQPYHLTLPSFRHVKRKQNHSLSTVPAFEGSMELECKVPPQPWASIYNPGGCSFMVIVRKDMEVHWLPEQIHDIQYRRDIKEVA